MSTQPSPSIQDASQVIAGVISATPIATSETLNNAWGFKVWFKLEMLQTTGSFKERGALYKLKSLTEAERKAGVVAASAGNHAQAVAYHAGRMGIPCTIVMPEFAPLIKVRNTASHGAKVVLQGKGYDEALSHAKELSDTTGLTFVHGFDDPWIIAGQGTIGLELLEQCPDLHTVIVPVGGGGLIAGIAQAIKQSAPHVRVVGVQCKSFPSARAAMDNGQPVKVAAASSTATIADGIAVRKLGQLCYEAIRDHVDEVVEVGESSIAQAVLLMLEQEKTVVEGAGAVGVAALQTGVIKGLAGKNVAVVLSGGNIDVNRLARIIDKGLVKDGRLTRMRLTVPDIPGELARILDRVAHCRANILDVEHHRAFSDATVGYTSIVLTLETRGAEHVQEIMGVFKSEDTTVEQLL